MFKEKVALETLVILVPAAVVVLEGRETLVTLEAVAVAAAGVLGLVVTLVEELILVVAVVAAALVVAVDQEIQVVQTQETLVQLEHQEMLDQLEHQVQL